MQHRPRRLWLMMAGSIIAVAAALLLIVMLQPVDVVQAAEQKLTSLTTYYGFAHTTGTTVDPQTGEKHPYESIMDIWYDQGKYRIQMDDLLFIFDGDTEWIVYGAERRVVKKPGMPRGRIQMSTVDQLIEWFAKYPHVVEGEETVNGRPATRVAVQIPSDTTQYVWLDKRTHLPVAGRSVSKDGSESSWTEHLEVNVSIDPALFTYQPPEGYTVDVMGPKK